MDAHFNMEVSKQLAQTAINNNPYLQTEILGRFMEYSRTVKLTKCDTEEEARKFQTWLAEFLRSPETAPTSFEKYERDIPEGGAF